MGIVGKKKDKREDSPSREVGGVSDRVVMASSWRREDWVMLRRRKKRRNSLRPVGQMACWVNSEN